MCSLQTGDLSEIMSSERGCSLSSMFFEKGQGRQCPTVRSSYLRKFCIGYLGVRVCTFLAELARVQMQRRGATDDKHESEK